MFLYDACCSNVVAMYCDHVSRQARRAHVTISRPTSHQAYTNNQSFLLHKSLSRHKPARRASLEDALPLHPTSETCRPNFTLQDPLLMASPTCNNKGPNKRPAALPMTVAFVFPSLSLFVFLSVCVVIVLVPSIESTIHCLVPPKIQHLTCFPLPAQAAVSHFLPLLFSYNNTAAQIFLSSHSFKHINPFTNIPPYPHPRHVFQAGLRKEHEQGPGRGPQRLNILLTTTSH